MTSLVNLDLFSVGIAIAGMGILGFIVFFDNRRSATNRAFLLFAIVAIIWGISNYLNSQFDTPKAALWNLRLHLFISVWYAFALFRLLLIFPKEKAELSQRYKFVLIPSVILVSVLTLTPFVFSKIVTLAPIGEVSDPDRRPGILLFAMIAVYLVFGGIFTLLKKLIRARGIEKTQFRYVFIGIITTFSLIIGFNLILPVFFHKLRFIPLGAVSTFPLAAFMAYAIFRHHLLNVKVITTEILTFVLAIVTLFEVVISKDILVLIFRSGVFALVLGFGILLIKSVLREVEQREQLQKLNEELEAAKAKLEDLSRFKTQLLSLASHQIKAPLAAIKGFVSILTDGLYGEINDKVKVTLGKIKYSADDLIDLINNLLDLRKVEEGKMEYTFQKTDLKKLVQGVVEELRPLANHGKNLEFTFTAPDGDAFVNADPQKLKQVIQNLVDNAIKYTPEGFVRVELVDEKEKGTIALSIKDSGLGIPADLLAHLFEEFIRDERVKRQIRGTGLGLFIAKKIVEAHGGQLWAESGGEDKGSAFTLRLRRV